MKLKMAFLQNHCLWADIAKGIAIILVIAGHTYPPTGNLCKFIFLFHMPLFFLLAGYFFNFQKYENNFKLLLKSSAKRLLLPILIVMLLFYDWADPTKHLSMLMYGCGKPQFDIEPAGYALWFLYCLFIVRILLWGLLKVITKVKSHVIINILASFGIAYCGVLIGKHIKLPWSIDVAMVSLYISYIGFLMKHYCFFDLKKRFHLIFAVIFIILGVIDYKYFGLSMNERFYSNPLISLNAAIGLSILLLYITKLMESMKKVNFIKYIDLLFQYIGVNTIIILATHHVGHSRISFLVSVLFKLFISLIYVEIIALIPHINKIFSAKSLREFFNLSR